MRVSTITSFAIMLILFCSQKGFSQVEYATIGSGTGSGTTTPIASWYNSSATESVYLGTEINKTGNIITLAYNKASGASTTSPNVKIYMKTTAASNVGTGSYTIGTSNFNAYTLVFDGALPNSSTSGWMEVTLDQAFPFPSLAQNLSVLVVSSTCISSGRPQFRYTTTSDRKSGDFNDGSIGCGGNNPFNPASSSFTARLERANIRLGFDVCPALNIPYTEDFQSITFDIMGTPTPAIPACSKIENINNDGLYWQMTQESGNKFLNYNGGHFMGQAADDWWYTPGINLTAGQSYQVSFKTKNISGTPQVIEVKCGASNTAASMSHIVFSPVTTGTYTNWVTYTANYTATFTGKHYFGWHITTPANGYILQLDDISIITAPVICNTPDNLNIQSVGTTTATAAWDLPNPQADAYEIYYSTSSADPTSGTTPTISNISTNSVNLNPLSSNTVYYVWVRSKCGSNYSAWSAVRSFRTECTPEQFPVVASITGADSICTQTTASYGNTSNGGVWSVSPGNLATINSSGSVTALANGTATVYYTISNACGTAQASKTIEILSAPVAQAITGNATVCLNETLQLSNAQANGTWSSGATNIATVSNTGLVSPVSTGTAVITYSVSNACGTADAIKTVEVLSTPAAPTISGDETLCLSASLQLAASPTGGTWSSSNTAVATVNNSGLVLPVATGNTDISYTLSNACGMTQVSKSIQITDVPLVSPVNGADIICMPNTEVYSNAIANGTWGIEDPTLAVISTAGEVTGTAAGNTFVTYTLQNTCGATTVRKAISIHDIVNAGTISGNASVCVSSTINLTASVNGGIWSSSNPAFASVSSNGEVLGIQTGTVIISYTVSNACSTAIATKEIRALSAPVTNPIVGADVLCAGESEQYVHSITGGTWDINTPALATISSSGLLTAIAAGTVEISYTINNSCGSIVSLKNITINTVPEVAAISASGDVVCTAGTLQLQNATSGGTWSVDNPSLASISNNGLVSGITYGEVNITYALTNTCGTTQVSKRILVDTLANPEPIVTNTSDLCIPASSSFTCASPNGIWSSSNTGIATVDAQGMVTPVSNGNAVIYYSVTGNCGTASADQPITVSSRPTLEPISGDNWLCEGSSIQLSNSTPGAVWSSDNTVIATVSANGLVEGESNGTTTILYTATNHCGSSQVSKTIEVKGKPGVDSFTIMGVSPAFIFRAVNPRNVNAYYWQFGNGQTSTDAAPTHTYTNSGTYTVTLCVFNECQSVCENIAQPGSSTVERVITVTTLSTDNISKEAPVTLYPNPFTNKLVITSTALLKDAQVLILDATGKQIARQSLTNNRTEFNTSGWAAGLYLVRISSEGYSQSYLIQKQ